MKKNMKNLATAFLLMGSSFIFTAAHASQTEPEAVVTFAGYKNTQPVYKLNIKNPENVKLNVVIKDQEGTYPLPGSNRRYRNFKKLPFHQRRIGKQLFGF